MNAKSYAYYLLGKRDFSEKELKDKLIRRGFSEEEVLEALNELKYEKVIDDKKLLLRLKEKAIEKGESSIKLKKKLLSKGIYNFDLSFEEELTSAINLLNRSYKREKRFEDVVKFLKNRGFKSEVIFTATKIFLEEEI